MDHRQQNDPETHSRDEDEPPSKRRKLQPQEEMVEQKEAAAAAGGPKWSEISQDVLELITARLHIGDRIQASRVCMHWRSVVVRAAPRSHPASYGNPCLLRLSHGNKRCTLTDHVRSERFVIDTPTISDGFCIADSNHGWLLLYKSRWNGTSLFFFNPLTQSTIVLPNLARSRLHTFSFMVPPTSPDCVVIALPTINANYDTCFFHCAPGDKKWRVRVFKTIPREAMFKAPQHRPFLFKDQIYHLDSQGGIAIYNHTNGSLTVVGEVPIRTGTFDYSHFVRMDDKVIFAYKVAGGLAHLFELDESEKQLIALRSAGGRSLFCCAVNCMLVKAATAGEKMYALGLFDEDAHWGSVCWIDLKP